MSPSQAAFGRDMLFDYPTKVDWSQQQHRKERQIQRQNERENQTRLEYEYQPDDFVMIARNGPGYPNYNKRTKVPFGSIVSAALSY
ncbi:hypothetical protein PC116_g1224 [Phytophthora cactorum]|nr:hypothetical protein PC120_g22742 [Phytophthora cactorum]KAG3023126.1 hypothetical protein PC119_g9020 [Phytophthora cactorum]KAG3184158.1 hypothetical protein C6341_g5115 [Phytophthora cactorum]KAG4041208.1 hypothetical protein PC123_g23270 [Phytophthora cactorum]KAG4251050.1 hypothetical protein PC116_g1224 [Phytophthora cactorum]